MDVRCYEEELFLAIQRKKAFVVVEGGWVHLDQDMLGLPQHIRDIMSQWHGECVCLSIEYAEPQ